MHFLSRYSIYLLICAYSLGVFCISVFVLYFPSVFNHSLFVFIISISFVVMYSLATPASLWTHDKHLRFVHIESMSSTISTSILYQNLSGRYLYTSGNHQTTITITFRTTTRSLIRTYSLIYILQPISTTIIVSKTTYLMVTCSRLYPSRPR